jgi:cupin fold WbuC family metalloprotein
MKIIDKKLLDKVSDKAKSNVRLRMNHNLHPSLDSNAQRLLNALEPGTVIPIHRHSDTSETYVILRGSLNMLLFNDKKELTARVELNPLKGKYGIDLPKNQWHTLEVLETGTIIFEVKDGPYKALEPIDVLK